MQIGLLIGVSDLSVLGAVENAILTAFSITENADTPDEFTVSSSADGTVRYAIYTAATDVSALAASAIFVGTGALSSGSLGTLSEGGGDITGITIEDTGLTADTSYQLVIVQDIDDGGEYTNVVFGSFTTSPAVVVSDVATHMGEQERLTASTATPGKDIDVSGRTAGDTLIYALAGAFGASDPQSSAVNGNAATVVQKWNQGSGVRGALFSYVLQAADITAGTITVNGVVGSGGQGATASMDFVITSGSIVDSVQHGNSDLSFSLTTTDAANTIYHFFHGKSGVFDISYSAGISAPIFNLVNGAHGSAAGITQNAPVGVNTITFALSGADNYAGAAVVIQ